jgi:hypothetical protein
MRPARKRARCTSRGLKIVASQDRYAISRGGKEVFLSRGTVGFEWNYSEFTESLKPLRGLNTLSQSLFRVLQCHLSIFSGSLGRLKPFSLRIDSHIILG